MTSSQIKAIEQLKKRVLKTTFAQFLLKGANVINCNVPAVAEAEIRRLLPKPGQSERGLW